MKKQYYYDYHQTLPSATSGQIEVSQEKPADNTQDVRQQPTPQAPQQPNQQTPPSTPPPPQAPPRAPIRGSNFLPIVVTVVLILIAATLVYTRLPRDYRQCTQWPGSRVSGTFPSTCTTFWGAQFTGNAIGDVQLPDVTEPSPTPSNQASNNTLGTDTRTDTPPTPQPSTTTKGGLPTDSTPPQPTPTSIPQLSGEGDSGTWVKHRYPEQHLLVKLPQNYSSTHVTRNRDTGIQTFSVSRDGTRVIDASIQDNWDNTGNARDQGISFMLGDTGVIKVDQAKETTYYFEYQGNVHIFRCYHQGNQAVKDTCDAAVKSIQFI